MAGAAGGKTGGEGAGPKSADGDIGPHADRADHAAKPADAADSGPRPEADAASPKPETPDTAAAAVIADAVHPRHAGPDDAGPDADAASATAADSQGVGPGTGKTPSRRPPSLTRDTARPEGGGRAAPGDASAPARQWPLLTVLALAGLGLVIVGSDAFADAFRVGTILIGVALLTGAVMRRTLPSVGMLAVRSRFTDMVTYGLLGTLIVLLALVTQPKPWLDVPFLEDAVHFTVR
ncbi:DUF3017 domain-containing protein [Streptomyces sp. NBC_01210]|uniref:DUF3017 domain-containing protein n=1 Tax=Streptomyces sp. NBC_01210 TaxID=2903774 RepID=UPI003FA3D49A